MNWDELSRTPLADIVAWAEDQPWCRAMADCRQDAGWHSEGDVWAHTQMVCAQLPHLAESDPTGKALGYVEDASKVDKTKFPAYKPGAQCATCNFFQAKSGDAYGPCQIFPGKSVSAKGWCASHSPKA